MPRLHETITVRRPVEEAFRYTADFTNIENWDPSITASAKTSPGPVAKGTTFELKLKFGTVTVPMVYTITEFEPPHRVVLVGESSTLRAVDEITFAAVPQGTVITYTADLTFGGVMKLVVPFLGPVVRTIGRRAVRGLAQALDGSPAGTADGS